MKKLALTLTVTLACVAAFAQGKVQLKNDSLHLIYYTTDASLVLSGDAAGAVISNTGVTGSGETLAVDLFAGGSATTLNKVGTTGINVPTQTPGTFLASNIILPNTMPGYAQYYFQVQVYDAASGSYANAAASNGHYYGASTVFTAFASSTAAYNSLVNAGTSAFSTWAVGTQALDSVLPGAKGAIALQANVVPEPTSLALLGLGAAGLMIFRRRK